jgi:NADPH2:quinone reductase
VGDRVLITDAAGGVGTAMVQIASVTGAQVVASVRRSEPHEKVKSLVTERDRFTVVTPDGQSGHGPFDVIVELVGGADCLHRVSLLRTGGRFLIVGVQAVMTASLSMFALMLARAKLIDTTIRGRSDAEKALLAHSIAAKVAPLLGEQRISSADRGNISTRRLRRCLRSVGCAGQIRRDRPHTVRYSGPRR